MLKVLVLSLIFAVCTAMGLVKRQELYSRKAELENVIKFAVYAKNEIIYHNKPLDAIITDKISAEISPFFYDIAHCDEPKMLSKYEKAKEKNRRSTAFTTDDIQCMDRLFSLLGKTCGDEQIKLLDNIINELEIKRANAVSDYNSKGSLYTKMGIAAGFLAVVICI